MRADERRISDWSSDVCSSGLAALVLFKIEGHALVLLKRAHASAFDRRNVHKGVVAAVFRRNEAEAFDRIEKFYGSDGHLGILCPMHLRACAKSGTSRLCEARNGQRGEPVSRSEEHTSELQSLMRISYAVFSLKKKKNTTIKTMTCK